MKQVNTFITWPLDLIKGTRNAYVHNRILQDILTASKPDLSKDV